MSSETEQIFNDEKKNDSDIYENFPNYVPNLISPSSTMSNSRQTSFSQQPNNFNTIEEELKNQISVLDTQFTVEKIKIVEQLIVINKTKLDDYDKIKTEYDNLMNLRNEMQEIIEKNNASKSYQTNLANYIANPNNSEYGFSGLNRNETEVVNIEKEIEMYKKRLGVVYDPVDFVFKFNTTDVKETKNQNIKKNYITTSINKCNILINYYADKSIPKYKYYSELNEKFKNLKMVGGKSRKKRSKNRFRKQTM
jgi:hypothetical protein